MKSEEIWKTYPEFPWVQGSSLGNLKTLDHYTVRKDGKRQFGKGHDLKQYHDGGGYMQAHININGEQKTLKTHRVVAACFLPNPDNLEQVNHKNCIRDDNCVWNLEWCDALYNSRYRDNLGHTNYKNNAPKLPLFAVVLKTGEVLHFESRHEAEQKMGISNQAVSAVIKGKLQQAGGYFFTEDESEITAEKIQSINDNMHFLGGTIAIAVEKREPLYFESKYEAGHELECSDGNIGSVIAGRRKQTKGFWFCNADSNAVKNTQAKFGNEVADKVAKLINHNQLKKLDKNMLSVINLYQKGR